MNRSLITLLVLWLAAMLPAGPLLVAPALAQAPTITAISPNAMMTGSTGGVVVFGSDFHPPDVSPFPTVTLRRDGVPDMTFQASNNGAGTPGDGELWVDFGLQDAPLGAYDVIVTRNDGQSDTLPAAFRIVADPGLKIRQIGAWGGSVGAVFIDDRGGGGGGGQTLAYVGSGVRMVILDVTDPANTVELGSVMFGAIVHDIKVRDGYAFIAAGFGEWLCVVDVADPVVPHIVSRGNYLGGGCDYNKVALLGDVAYMLCSSGGAGDQFNIANPASPSSPAGVCRAGGSDFVFSSVSSYAYKASGNWQTGLVLWIHDASAPGGPCPDVLFPIVGSVQLPGANDALHIYINIALSEDETYAFVSALGDGGDGGISRVFVVDISDPAAPFVAGIWTDALFQGYPHWIHGLAASDGRLYVVDWSVFGTSDPNFEQPLRALVILDVATDPTAPTVLGEYSIPSGGARGVTVVGTTVYLQDEREGLIILDCSDPANCVPVGGYFSPAVFQQGDVAGDTLFVTDRRYGVSILDVTDPRNPSLASTWETGSTNHFGIDEQDGLLYLAAGWAGVQVLDVLDPLNPILAGVFPFPFCVRSYGLEADGDIVHVGTVDCFGASFLVNFDVTDPGNIVEVGSLSLGLYQSLRTIDTRPDSISFGGGAYSSITIPAVIFDNADPADPQLIGHLRQASDVQVDGDLLYVAGSPSGIGRDKGLYIMDISDPYNPTDVGFHLMYPGHNPTAVAVVGGRVLMSDRIGDSSLDVYDVSNPAAPVRLARRGWPGSFPSYALPVTIEDLVVDGPFVYAVTSHSNDIGAGVLSYLVYVPGDFDDNGVIDAQDASAFAGCFTGPDIEPGDATSLIFDFDEDNDVDCDDWASFKLAWNGSGSPPGFAPCGDSGACSPGDVTTQGAAQGDLNFGFPDGLITGSDINYYVNLWVVLDLAADMTTQGAGVGDPGYGVPDGIVTGSDISYFVNFWVAGCP